MKKISLLRLLGSSFLALTFFSPLAFGQVAETDSDPQTPPDAMLFPVYSRDDVPAAAGAPAPYTPPLQLRPIMAGNVLRIDSALATYNDRDGVSGGIVDATVLTGSYRVVPDLAVLIRVGGIANHPANGDATTFSFMNPVVGGLYSIKLPSDLRMGIFLGLSVPVGSGGGNSPDPAVQLANNSGGLARSGMDGAMVSPNYFAVIPGIDLAYIGHGLTVQVEATLIQLNRVRGEEVDHDQTRLNLTTGLSVGYAITPELSVVGEVRYQRWLYNPTVFAAENPAVENLSFAVGPRLNLKIGKVVVRTGISYAQGLLGPMATGGYTSPTNTDHILFVDTTVAF